MCGTHDNITVAYETYSAELIAAGLLIPSGVPSVYGYSGVFENVIERFDALVTRAGAELKPEVMRFTPLLTRENYLRTDHLETFPNLMGSVHSFLGSEKELPELIRKRQQNEVWANDLGPTAVMLTPAVCYPLYPTASGTTLPTQGRLVDLRGFVFRHEPSPDPARLQMFRMHEFVRLGTPDQALDHRNYWLKKGEELLQSVGLDVKPVVANDPFFGRGGRVMAATQREQHLKYELIVPVATAEKPTAVASSNYHMDHFGHSFDIKSADGNVAHSACVGFGLERIALALFKTHGFDTTRWPSSVRQVMSL
ncbi:MAG: amino acid--[acyl-carrier-protein] ligase [Gammaproteobacteria bacterium]|nr:amino acid--[acyl-carrier-protein] ligase [Gammaproteobacteria bacterium]